MNSLISSASYLDEIFDKILDKLLDKLYSDLKENAMEKAKNGDFQIKHGKKIITGAVDVNLGILLYTDFLSTERAKDEPDFSAYKIENEINEYKYYDIIFRLDSAFDRPCISIFTFDFKYSLFSRKPKSHFAGIFDEKAKQKGEKDGIVCSTLFHHHMNDEFERRPVISIFYKIES